MEIQDIKATLTIQTVLNHYNLSPDKNHRLNFPWHNDKTPSLQIYPKTNTWTCFSINCIAGSGDVIDFAMKYEELSKHHRNDSFLDCNTMGEVVKNNIKLLLHKAFTQSI